MRVIPWHFQPAAWAGRAVFRGLGEALRHRDADPAGMRWQDGPGPVGGALTGLPFVSQARAHSSVIGQIKSHGHAEPQRHGGPGPVPHP